MSIRSGTCAGLVWFEKLIAPLVRLWRWVRAVAHALKPCRFSLLMVLAGILFLFAADQGLDTLRDFAERKAGDNHDASQTFFFQFGAVLWVYGSWYWARAMYYLDFGNPLPDTKLNRWIQQYMPRFIGGAAIASLTIAFLVASKPYASDDLVGRMLQRYALYCLLGAVAFLVVAIKRRDFSNRMAGWLEARGKMRMASALRVARVEDETYGDRELCDFFSRSWLLWGTLAIAIALFVAFAVNPARTAPGVGSAAILLLAASGWIAFGSMVDILSQRSRLPAFATLLMLAIVFSLWNDNHAPRALHDKSAALARDTRDDLRTALGQWLARQLPTRDPEIPLVIVAAEGGGIRAAYWTATVLGTIRDRHPDFEKRLFALSGVSGGSLGSSVFAALLAEGDRLQKAECAKEQNGTVYVHCGQQVLSEDFLSPAIAGMLYPDLFQRILPFPVPAFDRARALETSWEQAWRKHVGDDRYAQGFSALWAGDATHALPALFLNATWVETGKRFVVSNIRLASDGNSDGPFHDIRDGIAIMDDPVSLSTATHLSARFTYVSPAAAVHHGRELWGHVVDGGYFENSGTVTANEIVQEVLRLRNDPKSAPNWKKVKPVVVLISNEPLNPRTTDGTKDPRPNRLLNEALSPLDALLNAREARAAQAIGTIRASVKAENFYHFGLCNEHVTIPLGWTLSSLTEREMREQLASDKCPAYPNSVTMQRLDDVFSARR